MLNITTLKVFQWKTVIQSVTNHHYHNILLKVNKVTRFC